MSRFNKHAIIFIMVFILVVLNLLFFSDHFIVLRSKGASKTESTRRVSFDTWSRIGLWRLAGGEWPQGDSVIAVDQIARSELFINNVGFFHGAVKEGDGPMDYWGSEMSVMVFSDGVIIKSAGPDKLFETDDDIVYNVPLPDKGVPVPKVFQ